MPISSQNLHRLIARISAFNMASVMPIHRNLDTLIALHQTGTLDELAEIAEVISLGTAALDDEMVTSLAGTGAALGEIAQTASDEDTRDDIERCCRASVRRSRIRQRRSRPSAYFVGYVTPMFSTGWATC